MELSIEWYATRKNRFEHILQTIVSFYFFNQSVVIHFQHEQSLIHLDSSAISNMANYTDHRRSYQDPGFQTLIIDES